MSAALLAHALEALGPDVLAVALCAARLTPVSLLCPLLGGVAAPATVRLGGVLALSVFLHAGCGVRAPALAGGWALAAAVGREAALGTAVGLVAALPFDAARMGGRLMDLVRGTSAEASLPLVGTRESATGDGLHQLLVALVAAGPAMPLVLSALVRTFAWVPLGGWVPAEAAALQVAAQVGAALAAGLAVAAPLVAAVLALDGVLGLLARATPQLGLQEVGAPLRILGGGALLWLGVGVLCERLLAGVGGTREALQGLLEAGR